VSDVKLMTGNGCELSPPPVLPLWTCPLPSASPAGRWSFVDLAGKPPSSYGSFFRMRGSIFLDTSSE